MTQYITATLLQYFKNTLTFSAESVYICQYHKVTLFKYEKNFTIWEIDSRSRFNSQRFTLVHFQQLYALVMNQNETHTKWKPLRGTQKGAGRNTLGTGWFIPVLTSCGQQKKEQNSPSPQQTKQWAKYPSDHTLGVTQQEERENLLLLHSISKEFLCFLCLLWVFKDNIEYSSNQLYLNISLQSNISLTGWSKPQNQVTAGSSNEGHLISIVLRIKRVA